jgi:hypothetical protein
MSRELPRRSVVETARIARNMNDPADVENSPVLLTLSFQQVQFIVGRSG